MNVQLSSALKTKFSEEKKGNMIHWILKITINKTSENDVVSLYESFTHSPLEIITIKTGAGPMESNNNFTKKAHIVLVLFNDSGKKFKTLQTSILLLEIIF